MFTIKKQGTTIVVLSGYAISSTRIIKHRICKLITKVDGTIGDLATKANTIASLEDEMFEEFSILQVGVQDVER